jgi:cytochrome oxidase assembly protein ShyY1
VDPRALADSLPYALLPFVLLLAPDDVPRAAAPVRIPPPALGSGPHLAYAIQWFSIAVIAVVGTAALLRQKRPPPSRPS